MVKTRIAPLFALLLGALVCTSCQPRTVEPVSAATWFPLRIGSVTLQAQIAITPEEMATGLMHRASLGTDQGMLFVFPGPGPRAFYMLNTMIPLSIAYISPEGEILEIHDMQPHDVTSVRSHSDQVQYALEMNQGWFRDKKISPGARLDLQLVAEGIRQRQQALGAGF